jgi:hypothetical protein
MTQPFRVDLELLRGGGSGMGMLGSPDLADALRTTFCARTPIFVFDPVVAMVKGGVSTEWMQCTQSTISVLPGELGRH